jgi:hypothetical protein
METEEDYETDSEFDRQRAEEIEQALTDQEARDAEDSIMNEVFGSDDVVWEKSQPAPVSQFPKSAEEGLLVLSDDDDVDHPHSSDDDSEDDEGIPKVKEMKPLVLPTGAVVKIEKDFWQKDEEKRQRRIVRRKEKEELKKELKEAVESRTKTKAEMKRMQEESQAEIRKVEDRSHAQYLELQTQMKQLLQQMNSQTQGLALNSSQLPSPQVPLLSSNPPQVEEAQKPVADLSYPRLEDREDHVVSLAHDDVVACTPASQLPGVPSLRPEVFKVNTSEAMDVSGPMDNPDNVQGYPRVEDNLEVKGAEVAGATNVLGVPACGTSFESLSSPMSVEEERVDYEASDDEIRDNIPEGAEAGPSTMEAPAADNPQASESAKVHSSDPYGFN